MTENEVKGFIQGKLNCMNKCDVFDCKGTDECDNCEYCYSQGNFGEQKNAFEKAIQTLEEIQQYRAIGTVDEFKALKEKSVAKKPIETKENGIGYYECPNCNRKIGTDMMVYQSKNCSYCGQKLDWSEG